MSIAFANKIQRKISHGWKKESSKLGQLWNIERNFKTIYTNVQFLLRHEVGAKLIEMGPGSFTYKARGPRVEIGLSIGDQLVGVDPASKYENATTTERYTIVSERLLLDNIAVRTDEKTRIYRPLQQANFNESIPYNFQSKNNALILNFDPVAAKWQFTPTVPNGNFDYCWANFYDLGRARYDLPLRLPLSTNPIGWHVTLGLLPGVILREGDLLVDSDDDWYRIDIPYYQLESASLYQLKATRLRM